MAARSETVASLEGVDSVHAGTHETKPAPSESRGDENEGSFETDGYAVARGLFDIDSLDVYATYALMLRDNDRFTRRKEKCGFLDRYADTLTESILLHLKPSMEKLTGLGLLPTYSYLRIYETGSVLARHKDRRACEISASLTIGYDAREPWPLWLESRGRRRSVALGPGDMLVYKGREVPHWREPFGGGYWIQAFFHYVDADGPLASYKFDGRRGVGLPRE